jgi:hypothetical protein
VVWASEREKRLILGNGRDKREREEEEKGKREEGERKEREPTTLWPWRDQRWSKRENSEIIIFIIIIL